MIVCKQTCCSIFPKRAQQKRMINSTKERIANFLNSCHWQLYYKIKKYVWIYKVFRNYTNQGKPNRYRPTQKLVNYHDLIKYSTVMVSVNLNCKSWI